LLSGRKFWPDVVPTCADLSSESLFETNVRNAYSKKFMELSWRRKYSGL
jgi:hypothetical protein